MHSPIKKQSEFYITSYGAVGDGVTDNAIAIQKTIDACTKAGGGKVIVPAGHTYLAGPFNLQSNIEFEVEANARVLANPKESVYHKKCFSR